MDPKDPIQDPEKRVYLTEVEEDYPSKKVVIPALLAAYLVCFLFALDRTIIGTAIPAISNDFKSFGDIAWYEAGFLLPLCILQLPFGRILTFYSTKWILVLLVIVFEIGAIVCATAPSSKALIVGRVITGIGGAGVTAGKYFRYDGESRSSLTGILVLINTLVPLSKRPKYAGGLGAVFGLSSVLGPLLGGYLTAITWRWVFWINLPIGGVALVVLIIATPNRKPPDTAADTWQGRLKQLDPVGFILVAAATTCLLFALQFGGVQYPWNDGRVIALFVLAGVFAVAFICSQIWLDGGTIPGSVISQRSVLAAAIQCVGIGSLLVVYSFYLPIWFQAIKDDSPQSSGLSLLALLLSTVVFVILSGIGISTLGYYAPFAIISGAILVVGAGLLTTWQVDTGPGMWIGYQVIVGAGQGVLLQLPNIATQTVLSKELAPAGLAFLQFVQYLAGSVIVTICQTLIQNKLVNGLAGLGIDGVAIANEGATSLRSLVRVAQLPQVLVVYNDALRDIWYLSLALAILTFLSSFGYEWKNVKEEEKAKKVKDIEKAKEVKDEGKTKEWKQEAV